jgi:GDSL-like Lipase/Acylhydrolase family
MNRRKLLSGAAALSAFAKLLSEETQAQGIAPIVAPGISLQGFAKLQSATIQGFGDSITGNTNYFPSQTPLTGIPQRVASTVYPANTQAQNGGLAFYTAAGGTSGSGGGPTPASLTDGTVSWSWNEWNAGKLFNNYLTWAEIYSGGRLVWDMDTGYNGVAFGASSVGIDNGGSGYVNPVATITSGAAGTVQSSGGVVTGVTITQQGFGAGGGFAITITDSGGPGTGALAHCKGPGTGTLGVAGNTTANMVQRLADAVACPVDIMVVHAGTNDATTGVAPAVTIANLRTIYEALMTSGKKVIAIPVTPTVFQPSAAKAGRILAINRWVRAYCRGETWANPIGYRNVRLADLDGYFTDGTVNNAYSPIGGAGSVAGAMTLDGLHPDNRGGAYGGYAIWQAAQSLMGAAQGRTAPVYSAVDGYDPTYNVGGNMLEGLPWQANTVYALGAICQTASFTYYVSAVTGNATSASTAPSGFTTFADGNVTWTFSGNKWGRSNFSSSTGGNQVAATGIVYSGVLGNGWTLQRQFGSAAGTVACAIEAPWSDGQIGQRQTITWTLGAGTTNEVWIVNLGALANAICGITPADIGNAAVYAEVEIVVSGVANLTGIQLALSGDRILSTVGNNATGAGWTMLNSSGEMIAYPNPMMLRTQPLVIPSQNTTLGQNIFVVFNASGAAGSATLALKINYIGMRRAGVA